MRESAMVLADLGTPEDRTGPDIYAACYNLTGTSQHGDDDQDAFQSFLVDLMEDVGVSTQTTADGD